MTAVLAFNLLRDAVSSYQQAGNHEEARELLEEIGAAHAKTGEENEAIEAFAVAIMELEKSCLEKPFCLREI